MNAVNLSISTHSLMTKLLKILHALILLSFKTNEVLIKKDNSDFDVTIGRFNDAEICK